MKDSERPDSPIVVWMRHTKAPFILIKIKPNQTRNNAAPPLFSETFWVVTSEKCSIIVAFVAGGRCNLNSILTPGGFRATGTSCFDADRCDGYITAIRNATALSSAQARSGRSFYSVQLAGRTNRVFASPQEQTSCRWHSNPQFRRSLLCCGLYPQRFISWQAVTS